MKAFIVTIIISTGFLAGLSSYADAQSYNSQRARQDREYKSLSAATQRAYGTTSSSSTYRAPTTSNSYKRR
ncbi:MAG: hypothetical protein V4661_06465 [Pseudomonadota bacterium]